MRKTIAVLIESTDTDAAEDAAALVRYLDTDQTIPDGDHEFVGYDGHFSTMRLYHPDDFGEDENHFMAEYPALVENDVVPYESEAAQAFLNACLQSMREQFDERLETIRTYLDTYSADELYAERVDDETENEPPVGMFRFECRSISSERVVNVFTHRGRPLESPGDVRGVLEYLDDDAELFVAAFAVSF